MFTNTKKSCFNLSVLKTNIQKLGKFLSNMIMPNISIFIALGLINSLFMPYGWIPNKYLSELIFPISSYLLPILIGYTGGRLIGGDRGGIPGAISTIGIISNSSIHALLGVMISGPLAGFLIYLLDNKIQKRIKSGFEMLVNNFSSAIISILSLILSFFIIGPFVNYFSSYLFYFISFIIKNNLLPFSAIFIEPAKIFFLNNIINHGIFSPLGFQEVQEKGKSLFFLLESNPGPGLGVLISWLLFGYQTNKKIIYSSAIIHFFGGIHEIYFPYILKIPRLIIALILGSMTGIFFLSFFHGGLISSASPGSILSIIAMTPKDYYYSNLMSVFFSFFVSFVCSSFLLKTIKQKDIKGYDSSLNLNIDLNKNLNSLKSIDNITYSLNKDKMIKIFVACDAGMGSSIMGAAILNKKVKLSKLPLCVSVNYSAIDVLPKNADIVITHIKLTDKAKSFVPKAMHFSLNNFLDYHFYDDLIKYLQKVTNKSNSDIFLNSVSNSNIKNNINTQKLFKLTKKNIFLNQYAYNKEEAINFVGSKLFEQGYVKFEYIKSMLEREKLAPTWLGESIALPHGTISAKDKILNTGIIFCQFPKGVQFGENIDDIAHLVIGIAARNNEHVMVVSSLTNALDNENIIKELSNTKDSNRVLEILSL
ncbi:PTS mannitol transporter subunit IICBA [Buchnera aphidicola (Neophyllaphis podocarpi)]|uniref:PTS mannitol transporter subunit IICBA n=1 Tax=Buchnera aphidicola TaxID=9 RepID=UPI0031B89932